MFNTHLKANLMKESESGEATHKNNHKAVHLVYNFEAIHLFYPECTQTKLYVNKCQLQQNNVAFGSTQERNFYDPSIIFSHFHLLERAT
jgi:hypothetical protein